MWVVVLVVPVVVITFRDDGVPNLDVVFDGLGPHPARDCAAGAPARERAAPQPGDPARVARRLPSGDRGAAVKLAVWLGWAAGVRLHACPRRDEDGL